MLVAFSVQAEKLVVFNKDNGPKIFVFGEGHPDKVFAFTPEGYIEKAVKVTRSEDDLIFENEEGVITVTSQMLKSETFSNGTIAFIYKKVAPEIAEKCKVSNLTGRYFGEWARGGFKTTFWIFSLNEDCKAEVAYGRIFNRKVEIQSSIKEFVCNPDTLGKCRFSFEKDGSLKANYQNSVGGRNWADFKRATSPVD